MDPKNDQIFALRNLSTILHIEIFFNVKTHLNHQFDLKYERSGLNHYGSSLDMLRLVRSVCQTCEKSTQFFTIA